LADLDGDGRSDLFSGSTCCREPFCFYVFRRRADGTFGPREDVELSYPAGAFDRYQEFPLNGLKSRVAAADWNDDGKTDLLVGGAGAVPLGVVFGPLARQGPLVVKRIWPREKEPLGYLTANAVLADWDRDGRADLVCGTAVGPDGKVALTGARGVYWLRNVGTRRAPRLGPPQSLLPDGRDDETPETTGIAVADWNADGRPDLIVSRADYRPGSNRWVVEHHRIWVYLRRGG
jgi:hypothetical protein